MIMYNTSNGYSYFVTITLLILPSSFYVEADYPSFASGPNSWRNVPSSYFSLWESAGVRPILVNGMFVCGFHCSIEGENCLFSVSLLGSGSNFSSSAEVVWSANRNNPLEIQAVLELTSEGRLMLKDAKDNLVWSEGKFISGLNLSAEGNLMLVDKTDRVLWQSFKNPTDSLVLGQRFKFGQELKASVSQLNSSEGLYSFANNGDGYFIAYMSADPSQIYFQNELSWSNTEFQIETSGSFSVSGSANFIRLESDGHLKAYEWRESKWQGTDLLSIDPCMYPLACGEYGVCSETGCSCPDEATESETVFFRRNLDLGCHAVSQISCELPHRHSFLQLQGNYNSLPVNSWLYSNRIELQDCKQACLNNCSCKAAIYEVYMGTGCYFLSEVLSIYSDSYSYKQYSVFIKVQSSTISESPNRNLSSPNFPQRKKQNTSVIVGSTLGAFLFLGVFLICTFFFPRFNKGFQEAEEDYLDNMPGMLTRFSSEELKSITKNFSEKLGEGGFGSVFHGTLPSGSEVAVKQLAGFGPVNKSFIAEVETIGSIHHFNLVTLIGFCAEKLTRLLVYEYMANGSLDQWIYNANQETCLGWQIRKKIILDIAKGLAYLHEECNQKIIHLDIKPQNILLDENFNAKVSDFGLSKLIRRDQSRVVTTMRGTPGYMAPEWLSSVITEKVDVYSFGIVVLEILCGRRNFDVSQQDGDRHLLGAFKRKQEEGQLIDLVDKCSDNMQSNAEEVVEMMKVAAWCLQTEYGRRPSMSTVVKLFEGSIDVVVNEDFLNGLTAEATETFASTVLPSMLSGPR